MAKSKTITSVKAPTNAWGVQTVPGGHWEYGNTTGFPEIGVWHHVSNRGPFYSKNPIRYLAGGTPWRDQSWYWRFVRRYEDVRSSVLDRGWYRTYTPPGHDQSGLNLISTIDGYFNILSTVDDWSLENEAKVKALNRLGDRKIGWGTNIGELDKTFHHLCRSASDLLRAIRAAKRGRWREVQSILGMRREQVLSGQFPANRWLEYQYGWKPLLSTISDYYNVVQGQAKKALLIYGKGSGSRSLNEDFVWTDWDQIQYRAVKRADQVCYCKVWGQVTSESLRSFHQIDLINPLQVAWELVPFSFVIDWFMPVGNCIEAMTATAGVEFVSGYYGFVTGGRVDNTAVGYAPGGLIRPGRARCRLFAMQRIPLYDWPRPLPYLDNSPFSTPRTLSALALWRGTLKIR